MPSIDQENLETVMIDFFGALRRGDFDAASSLLDPDVAWQGLREEWVCHGREEVLDTCRTGLEERREIDRLEFTRAGDQVVMGARGTSITEVGGEPLGGQVFNVFALRDGRIVRIDDYRSRSEALAAAGAAGIGLALITGQGAVRGAQSWHRPGAAADGARARRHPDRQAARRAKSSAPLARSGAGSTRSAA